MENKLYLKGENSPDTKERESRSFVFYDCQ